VHRIRVRVDQMQAHRMATMSMVLTLVLGVTSRRFLKRAILSEQVPQELGSAARGGGRRPHLSLMGIPMVICMGMWMRGVRRNVGEPEAEMKNTVSRWYVVSKISQKQSDHCIWLYLHNLTATKCLNNCRRGCLLHAISQVKTITD